MDPIDYKPRIGSIAYRTIEHLSMLGDWLEEMPLCVAVDADSSQMSSSLRLAIEAGAVLREDLENGARRYRTPPKPVDGVAIPEISKLRTAPASWLDSITGDPRPGAPFLAASAPPAVEAPTDEPCLPAPAEEPIPPVQSGPVGAQDPEQGAAGASGLDAALPSAGGHGHDALADDEVTTMSLSSYDRSSHGAAPPSSVAEPDADLEPRHFACGAFSDGRMVLEIGDRVEELAPSEADVLFRYLSLIGLKLPQVPLG